MHANARTVAKNGAKHLVRFRWAVAGHGEIVLVFAQCAEALQAMDHEQYWWLILPAFGDAPRHFLAQLQNRRVTVAIIWNFGVEFELFNSGLQHSSRKRIRRGAVE